MKQNGIMESTKNGNNEQKVVDCLDIIDGGGGSVFCENWIVHLRNLWGPPVLGMCLFVSLGMDLGTTILLIVDIHSCITPTIKMEVEPMYVNI